MIQPPCQRYGRKGCLGIVRLRVFTNTDVMTTPTPLSGRAPDRRAADGARPGRAAPTWVPIRKLSVRHRSRIRAHLGGLDTHDRYLRFGHAASEEQLDRYVASLDFVRDEILGIFNRRLELIGLAHLAYDPAPQLQGRPPMAEFGVSVMQKGRGRGYGERLFQHAILHARNRGIETLFIHALSENGPMLRMARRAGAKVERDGSESVAWLKLQIDTIGSHMDELLGDQAAELNYQWKLQARRMDRLWGRLKAPFASRRKHLSPGDDA